MKKDRSQYLGFSALLDHSKQPTVLVSSLGILCHGLDSSKCFLKSLLSLPPSFLQKIIIILFSRWCHHGGWILGNCICSEASQTTPFRLHLKIILSIIPTDQTIFLYCFLTWCPLTWALQLWKLEVNFCLIFHVAEGSSLIIKIINQVKSPWEAPCRLAHKGQHNESVSIYFLKIAYSKLYFRICLKKYFYFTRIGRISSHRISNYFSLN